VRGVTEKKIRRVEEVQGQNEGTKRRKGVNERKGQKMEDKGTIKERKVEEIREEGRYTYRRKEERGK
jgi:hypothetical protein